MLALDVTCSVSVISILFAIEIHYIVRYDKIQSYFFIRKFFLLLLYFVRQNWMAKYVS